MRKKLIITIPTVQMKDKQDNQAEQAIAKKIYQKTFIDPKLEKYTRIFSDQEISEWTKEDEL